MIRVLLVEDSKFLRLATERALIRAGFEVSTAANGEQVLQVAKEKLPDLIMLDLLLPKMTGADVLKALKSDPATAGIAVVVLSAMSGKNADRLLHDGAFAFLLKEDLRLGPAAACHGRHRAETPPGTGRRKVSSPRNSAVSQVILRM